MFDIEYIAVDPKKASEGTWVSKFGAKFKIARYSNSEAEAARASALADFYQKLSEKDGAKVDEKDTASLRDIQARVMADHVLLDWKNLGQKGKELKYSPDAAYKILRDPKYQDLFNLVLSESLSRDNFAAAADKEIVKDVKRTASS